MSEESQEFDKQLREEILEEREKRGYFEKSELPETNCSLGETRPDFVNESKKEGDLK